MSYVNYFFFLMIRRPPRSTLFPYTTALPILDVSQTPQAPSEEAQADPGSYWCERNVNGMQFVSIRRDLGDKKGPQNNVPIGHQDRKSTRLNSSHANISYAVFCLKKNTHNHSS